MPTIEDLKQLEADLEKRIELSRLLPQLSLGTTYRMWRKGQTSELVKFVETIYLKNKALSGVKNPECTPITLCDILDLMQFFGWFAPAGEFIPPANHVVENHNRYITLAARQTIMYPFTICDGEVGKLKYLNIDAENLTAMESIELEVRYAGKREPSFIKSDFEFGAINACDEMPGSFSVPENITIPTNNVLQVIIFNASEDSEAVVNLTAKLWRMR